MNRPPLHLRVISLGLAVLLPLAVAEAGNNQALLQQAAANAQKQHQLQTAAAAKQHLLLQQATNSARQHQLSTTAATAQQQLLLKAHENFSKQHLLEQASHPARPAGTDGGQAGREEHGTAITSIQRD